MKKIYLFCLRAAGSLFLLFSCFPVSKLPAQVVRPYSVIYSDNLNGGHVIFGNTILAREASAMNYFSIDAATGTTSIYGNDNNNMQFVDIDGVGSTFNSSSADLVLPAGVNTIRYARLYWGGRITTGDSRYSTRMNVSIRKGTGTYVNYSAPLAQVDETVVSGSTHHAYQAYIDVSTFVNANGAGTYTVANIATTTGSVSNGGYYGGWALVVVYENAALPYSSIRIFDGFLQVYDGGSPVTQSITLTGLNVPSILENPSDASMSVMSWEGDANLAASGSNPNGDYMMINGTKVTNSLNPVNNFWNGTISQNGVHVTTKNPHYLNQMGIDIDQQDVGTGFSFPEGISDIVVEFGTEADQYFPSLFGFTIKSKLPAVFLDKTGTTSLPPYNLLNPNEIITYTISGKNAGRGHAYQCIITDTIPTGLSFVKGSLRIVQSPGGIAGAKTDADGDDQAMQGTAGGRSFVRFYIGEDATYNQGGLLGEDSTYVVEFQCLTPPNATAINSVTNTARIRGVDFKGDPFVDDGTFIIGPQGIPLAVRLIYFSVNLQNQEALLRWSTAAETDNDHFEIERSYDGLNYTRAGSVNGNGTVYDTHDYQFRDPLYGSEERLFYRLRIVDINGRGSYSPVVALLVKSAIPGALAVYPNPFAGNLTLRLNVAEDVPAQVVIIASNGQTLVSRAIPLNKGSNIVTLNDLGGLPSGWYLAEVRMPGVRLVQKIQKQ